MNQQEDDMDTDDFDLNFDVGNVDFWDEIDLTFLDQEIDLTFLDDEIDLGFLDEINEEIKWDDLPYFSLF